MLTLNVPIMCLHTDRTQDDIEGTSGTPKRSRNTPTPAADVTHISDSATQESSLAVGSHIGSQRKKAKT